MTNPIDTARDAPERIWATEDRKNFGEDRFHATTPMRGLTEYLRADRAASQADTARQEGVSLGLAMARAIADEIRAISDAAAGKTSTGPHSYGAGYDAGERAVIHHFAVELEDKSPIPPHIVAARVLLDVMDPAIWRPALAASREFIAALDLSGVEALEAELVAARNAVRSLLSAMINNMTADGLPLEWAENSAIAGAFAALGVKADRMTPEARAALTQEKP